MRFETGIGPEIVTTSKVRIYPYFKPFFEIALVLMAAPLVLPIVAVLAVLIMLDGGAPFYSQWRLGRGGRPFRMWKLRSMVSDAECALETHLQTYPEARREWDRIQKLQDDPRVTPLGRFLRKTSLDELPQLLNVLLGEMALVGPRPILPEQADRYPERTYYRMRPGLTGLWQISGRGQSLFGARGTFDTIYESAMSFTVDIQILFRTLVVVWRGTGV
ncbi:sugar transferase [Actibacterium pelagium]|uniref:Sugar transferase n=1 Tax=Actibacterium pelagium TaxID=2029103 RepID=A0A917AJ66_9RHOB|nr:sugar transferase [Actibacterium pelagium]GGE56910.1 sugar transferase [Actibacterium pelagium]